MTKEQSKGGEKMGVKKTDVKRKAKISRKKARKDAQKRETTAQKPTMPPQAQQPIIPSPL